MDTGPIVALIDVGQRDTHNRIQKSLTTLSLPFVTTNPCFTEMLYLVGRSLGYPAQLALWQMRAAGKFVIHVGAESEIDRCYALMMEYRDIPMDYADASLVAAAEVLGVNKIFTLDSHFYAYRLQDGSAFEVIP